MTDVFKIIVKYRRKIIAKFCHLSPRGNRALNRYKGKKQKQNTSDNFRNCRFPIPKEFAPFRIYLYLQGKIVLRPLCFSTEIGY